MKYEAYIFSAYAVAGLILLVLIIQSVIAWGKVKGDGDA